MSVSSTRGEIAPTRGRSSAASCGTLPGPGGMPPTAVAGPPLIPTLFLTYRARAARGSRSGRLVVFLWSSCGRLVVVLWAPQAAARVLAATRPLPAKCSLLGLPFPTVDTRAGRVWIGSGPIRDHDAPRGAVPGRGPGLGPRPTRPSRANVAESNFIHCSDGFHRNEISHYRTLTLYRII